MVARLVGLHASKRDADAFRQRFQITEDLCEICSMQFEC